MNNLKEVRPFDQGMALFSTTTAFTICFAVWTIFAIIGVQIKQDMGLTDTQFSLLIGTPILTGSLVFNYFMAEPSLTYGQWTVRGQYESIAGNGTTAMQFALGTNHAFNGWVDKFLTTPANGLIDSNIGLEYVFKSDMSWINGAKTIVRYHKFRAENKNRIMDYGSETDFLFEKSFKNNFVIGVKAGKYRAKGLYTNTVKVMPYVSFKF